VDALSEAACKAVVDQLCRTEVTPGGSSCVLKFIAAGVKQMPDKKGRAKFSTAGCYCYWTSGACYFRPGITAQEMIADIPSEKKFRPQHWSCQYVDQTALQPSVLC
jgi:hypothetical protein